MEDLTVVPGQSGYMNLTAAERDTLQHVERFGASISLVGVCFIFLAYGLFKRVRTVPNTFILFASIANVGASIACLIGYAGILAGDSSALCQTQAFLLEMFMQSDPWWSFAMAVNVYMVFFMAYHPNNFRRHLWVYCLVCFGMPAVPAFVCLFYAPNGVRIYGNATLWCWVDDTYNQLRIFTYYLPIWMCILLSAVIYVAVGYHVFHQRNQLRNLTLSNQAKDVSGADGRGSAEKELQGSYGMVTTELHITAESSASQTQPPTPTGSITPVLHRPPLGVGPDPWGSPDDDDTEPVSPTTLGHIHTKPFTTISSISSARPRDSYGAGREQQQHGGGGGSTAALGRAWRKFTDKLHKLDPIKLAYLRTSFVFAISVLVTWTPSSINRVYSLMYPARTSYALSLAGAIVLPLQGVWNAVIFAATSWSVLKEELGSLQLSRSARRRWRWWCWPGFLSFCRPQSRRINNGDDDDDGRGTQVAAAAGFRGRYGSAPAPDSREFLTSHRMANVRVIRGGSL